MATQADLARWARRGTTTERGLGSEHQRRRDELLPAAIGTPCPIQGPRCTGTMVGPDLMELDHSVPRARGGTLGDRIVCAPCNHSEGAKLGNQIRGEKNRAFVQSQGTVDPDYRPLVQQAPRLVSADQAIAASADSWSARRKRAEWRRDPNAWAESRGIDLYSKQREINNTVVEHDRVAVRSCHSCLDVNERVPLYDGRVVRAGDLIGTAFVVPGWAEDGRQEPRLAVARDNGIEPVWRVTTDSGRQVVRTGNHPLWSGRLVPRTRREGGLRSTVVGAGWTKTESLRVGDLVLVPQQLRVEGGVPRSDAEVTLLGYMLGDGSMNATGMNVYCQPGATLDELRRIVHELGGRLNVRQDSGCLKVGLVSPADCVRSGNGKPSSNPVLRLARQWNIYGLKAWHKRLADWAWQLPNRQLALLMNALFACDGWVHAGARLDRRPTKTYRTQVGEIGICLASEQLIRDIELVMLRLGISGNVRHRKVGHSSDGGRFDAWEWKATRAEEVLRFLGVIGTITGKEEATERIRQWAESRDYRHSQRWRDLCPEGYRWDRVRSIDRLGDRPTVAFSVDEDHAHVTTVVDSNSGKSFCMAVLVGWWLDSHPLGTARVVSTAPTLDQVRGILWVEINGLWERQKLPGRINQTEIWHGSYQAAVGRKSSDYQPAAMSGWHAPNLLVIVDEADGVSAALWGAIDTLATNVGAKIVGIGNPDDPQSEFRKRQSDQPFGGQYKTVKISAWDTPNFTGEPVAPIISQSLLSPDWVQEMRFKWGARSADETPDHPFWQSKVEAEYPDESANAVIRLSDLLRARRFERTGRLADYDNRFPTRAGVDVAGSDTGDQSVIRGRRGLRLLDQITTRTGDPEELEDWLVENLDLIGARQVAIDADGIGFGFAGALRRRRSRQLTVTAIRSSAAAGNPKAYLNRRAEMWWQLREALAAVGDRQLDFTTMDEATAAQLLMPRYSTEKGKIKIESKDDLRKRMGRSPDNADAVVYVFAEGLGGGQMRVSRPRTHLVGHAR